MKQRSYPFKSKPAENYVEFHSSSYFKSCLAPSFLQTKVDEKTD